MTGDRDERLSSHLDLVRACATDRTLFAREFLNIDPHEGQQRWFEGAWKPENAITAGNRWGKSVSGGVTLIHACAYRIGWDRATKDAMARKHEPYRGINIAITADQAGLVWRKAQAMLQAPKAQILVADIKMTPFPTIVFANGATLEARSTARDGVYLLGHDYDIVNWDEAAQEPRYERVRDNVVRMRLVDRGGTLYHTSTGNGRNEYGKYFLRGLEGKDPNLYCQTGSTFENPNIRLDQVQMNAERMTEKMRMQNIEGSIIDGGGTYFPIDDLKAAIDDDLDAMACYTYDEEDLPQKMWLCPHRQNPEWPTHNDRPWEQVYPSHTYLHAWDLADKQDWMVGLTYDLSTRPRATLVEFERFHRRGWEFNKAKIRERQHRFRTPRATKLDITGLGDVILSDLSDIRASGVNFAGGRKDELLVNLQTVLANRSIRWPSGLSTFYDEHAFYERKDDKLDTDCVMANAVAGWYVKLSSIGSRWSFAIGSNVG